MIQLSQYWMGRDKTHLLALSPAIEKNAVLTVELANKLLVEARRAGVDTRLHPNGSHVSSGWRPPAVNSSTPNAAPNSRHLTAQAIDLYDPEGELDEWLLANPEVLADLGLWLEHPSATKGWCHVQTVPPRSGNRVFYP